MKPIKPKALSKRLRKELEAIAEQDARRDAEWMFSVGRNDARAILAALKHKDAQLLEYMNALRDARRKAQDLQCALDLERYPPRRKRPTKRVSAKRRKA